MMVIRKSVEADFPEILSIVNEAAHAYRGVIPADRWQEPYMPSDELAGEINRGVEFWVAEQDKYTDYHRWTQSVKIFMWLALNPGGTRRVGRG